mgnify:CR=1 FL=1
MPLRNRNENNIDPLGFRRSVTTGATTQTVGSSLEGLIGIRLKSTHLSATVIPEMLSVVMNGNGEDENGVRINEWRLLFNPIITDTPTWTSAHSNSPIEYAVGSGGNLITGEGEQCVSGFGSAGDMNIPLPSLIRPGNYLHRSTDQLWLCIASMSGSTEFGGAITFREVNIS